MEEEVAFPTFEYYLEESYPEVVDLASPGRLVCGGIQRKGCYR
jgi:hypothetical protein